MPQSELENPNSERRKSFLRFAQDLRDNYLYQQRVSNGEQGLIEPNYPKQWHGQNERFKTWMLEFAPMLVSINEMTSSTDFGIRKRAALQLFYIGLQYLKESGDRKLVYDPNSLESADVDYLKNYLAYFMRYVQDFREPMEERHGVLNLPWK